MSNSIYNSRNEYERILNSNESKIKTIASSLFLFALNLFLLQSFLSTCTFYVKELLIRLLIFHYSNLITECFSHLQTCRKWKSKDTRNDSVMDWTVIAVWARIWRATDTSPDNSILPFDSKCFRTGSRLIRFRIDEIALSIRKFVRALLSPESTIGAIWRKHCLWKLPLAVWSR